MKIELLPCPFCGGAPRTSMADVGRDQPFRYIVGCSKCPICMDWQNSQQEAAEAWNTRLTSASEARRKALTLAADHFEEAVRQGYDPPIGAWDQCEHGKSRTDECIACYDERLYAAVAAIRNLIEKDERDG